jgi:hypothetical protein
MARFLTARNPNREKNQRVKSARSFSNLTGIRHGEAKPKRVGQIDPAIVVDVDIDARQSPAARNFSASTTPLGNPFQQFTAGHLE